VDTGGDGGGGGGGVRGVCVFVHLIAFPL
jgi:hypothetical protein